MLKKAIFNIIFIIIVLLSNCYFYKEIKTNEKDILVKEYINNYKNEKKNYYMLIEIKSINLNKEIKPYNSKYNDIKYGIELLESDLPDKKNGNLILASHRGNSKVSYFNNLDKMKYGDKINIYFKNKKYTYIYKEKYDIKKTGKAYIKNNHNINQITLITCKKEDKDKQVIYLGYLE